jgi:hypothetical protein
MTPDRHTRHFDQHWLPPVIGTDGAELLGTQEPCLPSEASNYDPAGVQLDDPLAEFDAALDEIATHGCRACPLCGLIMVRRNSFSS